MSKRADRPRQPWKARVPVNKKDPPPDAVERIRALAADGMTVRGVALRLGVTIDVMHGRWFEEFPELREAFEEGRENERYALHNKIYRTAMEGKGRDALLAAMFLLKARHGYREGEQQSEGNRVAITFNMPAAQPLDQFITVDDESGSEVKRLSDAAARAARRG